MAEIEWVHEREVDVIHLIDGEGDPVSAFGKEGGKFHAIDHRGLCVAEAARLEDVVERVLGRGERLTW